MAPVDWVVVGPAWRQAFLEAWEAFRSGSPPVGAVVVDAAGVVVASGRSRRGDSEAPANQLFGSRLAHAEVNALAQLGVDQHRGHELLTTLRPCFLCAAALAMSHVPHVSFAGDDPMWRFVEGLGDTHPVLGERWYTASGPMAGPLGTWATLLPLVERLARKPSGTRVDEYLARAPGLVALAQDLVASDRVADLLAMGHDDALASLWDDLVKAAG
jgi:tRNA(Arg) A34 adenosine deaminase TadA